MILHRWSLLLCFVWLLAGCGASAAPPENSATPVEAAEGEPLRVVATTTILADVVGRIGGEGIALRGLLPPGADPHSYQPTPDDLRAISDAHLIFVNGLGLEESLASILEEAQARAVVVNDGVELIAEEEEEEGEGHAEEEHDHSEGNPHTWWSIAAVEVWSRAIEESLSSADPAQAALYAANGAAYRAELAELRAEVAGLLAGLVPEQRKLATDHDTLAYFARDYDFAVVGLVIPSASTLAESSARHLADLQNQLRAEGVGAIFVGSTVSSRQAEQLAQDLGIAVVPIFTDSLSDAEGPAASYIDFMRHNVGLIVAALGNGG